MQTSFQNCSRISVVGTTGSGKTTLARQIARHFQIPHIELDTLHWEPNWTPAAPEMFRQRVREAVAGNRWVVDGNYGGVGVRDIVWSQADTVVFLDYSFWLAIVLWMLRTYQQNRRKYPKLFQRLEYAHLSIVHLQSPKMAEEWLSSFRV
jgi:adenylate kinase family enzyme